MPNAPDPLSRREGRSSFAAIGLLLGVYLLTRVGSLDVLPIFLDEAVHIQWAERLYDEGRILRPVGAGRLLAVAAYGLALPFDDRIWAARFIAALVGGLTLGFTFLLSRSLFSERAGLLAGFLYIASPFALVYDRLALSDGFLTACLSGVLFATLRLARDSGALTPRILLATMLALAITAKVSAVLFLLSAPLGLWLLSKDRGAAFRFATPAFIAGLAAALPMLWVFYGNRGEIAAQHVVDLTTAGSVLMTTLRDMAGWVVAYFTPLTVLGALLSAFFLRDSRAAWLCGAIALPFLFFAALSQPWSARYVLPVLPPLLALIAGGIDQFTYRFPSFPPRAVMVILGLLVSLQGLAFDRFLLFDPANAPYPEDDRRQLVTGWPAGYGVRELALRLNAEAADGAITVYVDTGGTRTVPTSLAILLARSPRVRLLESDLGAAEVRASMTTAAIQGRVYAVMGPRAQDFDFRSALQGAVATRLDVYQRPGGEWAATLFRVEVASARAVPAERGFR